MGIDTEEDPWGKPLAQRAQKLGDWLERAREAIDRLQVRRWPSTVSEQVMLQAVAFA